MRKEAAGVDFGISFPAERLCSFRHEKAEAPQSVSGASAVKNVLFWRYAANAATLRRAFRAISADGGLILRRG